MSSTWTSVELVERLFSRFVAFYGSQKVGAMWASANVDEVKSVWAEQLTGCSPESIKGALQLLIQSGREWPPTLPEFVALIGEAKEYLRTQNMPSLLGHNEQVADPNSPVVQEALAELRRFTAARRVPS